MIFKKKEKGAVSLFTGIAVLFVSIIFLGIFIYFSMNYFGNLEDSQRIKNNRDNLAIISGVLEEIKDGGIGSYKKANINPTDAIIIDHIENTITIRQEIKNSRSLENLKDVSNIGNLEITRQENSILYTLDYNGVINFSESASIMTNMQEITFEKVNEIDGISVVFIKNQEIFLEDIKISSPIDNITYSLSEPIEFKGILTNTVEEYDCLWESDINGVIGEECTLVVENLLEGEHKITFKVIKEEEVISLRNLKIIIEIPEEIIELNFSISSPLNNSEYDFGDNITLTGNIEQADGSNTCTWRSSLNGEIGNGCNINTSSLSAGNHRITLNVSDEKENKNKTINVLIKSKNLTASIFSPSNNSEIGYGEDINFTTVIEDNVGEYTCYWTSSIDGEISSQCNFLTDTLSVGTHTVTLSAQDQETTVVDQIEIEIIAPSLVFEISSPEDNSTNLVSQDITFTGNVSQYYETYTCSWSSSIDGFINEGCNIDFSSLSTGSHTITLSVTDEYQTLTETINITVKDNFTINFLNPGSGSTHTLGDNINFEGSASNTHGSYTCSFSSSIDGSIGSGCNINSSSLSIGSHVITLSITDSLQTRTTTRNITVDAGIQFVSKWNTSNPGTSGSNQITLPLVSTGSYNFNVDWGDGTSNTITSYNQAEVTHTYATAGEYTVSITGDIEGFSFNYSGDYRKIIEISEWGGLKLGNNGRYFYGANNLVITATDILDLTGTTNLQYMFAFTSLTQVPSINDWNFSNVTDMSYMFYYATAFNQNIGSWNVANVINMSYMFYSVTNFNQNIGSWNVANVTNMSYMFRNATAFNQDIGSWNVANVTNMSSMFYYATNFNQNIGSWNVAKVTNMSSMFYYATMSYMFYYTTNFNQDIGSWNVANVTNMSSMFYYATNFNQNIGSWNVANVTNMSYMFRYATAFNQNIGAWNVAKVTMQLTLIKT